MAVFIRKDKKKQEKALSVFSFLLADEIIAWILLICQCVWCHHCNEKSDAGKYPLDGLCDKDRWSKE